MNPEGENIYQAPFDRIKKLMEDTFGQTFKAYYEGDPIEIPKVNLPCMIFETQAGRAQLDATSTDRVQRQINIRVVFNKEDDYNAKPDQNLTEKKLRMIVEAQDPQTGEYLKNTVVGALRYNLTLQSSIINNDIDWQYDLQPRSAGLVTSEATVQVAPVERVIVGNRL